MVQAARFSIFHSNIIKVLEMRRSCKPCTSLSLRSHMNQSALMIFLVDFQHDNHDISVSNTQNVSFSKLKFYRKTDVFDLPNTTADCLTGCLTPYDVQCYFSYNMLLGFIEDLRRFSSISAISRLESRIYNKSLKFNSRGRESNPGPLAPQAKSLTTRQPPLPHVI